MNQRFRNEDAECVSREYAGNELYGAVMELGTRFEYELGNFMMRPEECFVEVLELLSEIVKRGDDLPSCADMLWLRKYNEYRRFNTNAPDDELSKAVGIVFAFAALATASSNIPFYCSDVSELLTATVCNHKFEGWASTLDQIYSLLLPVGWFDRHPGICGDDECGANGFASETEKVRTLIPAHAAPNVYIEKQYNNNCLQITGKLDNPKFINTRKDEAI